MSDPTVHATPVTGDGRTPCCHRRVFEVQRHDLVSVDPDAVTCRGGLPLTEDIEATARFLEWQANQTDGGATDGLRQGAAAVWALRRRHPALGDDWNHEGEPCPGGDVTCPGFDGDQCHYLGPAAWPIPTPQTPAGDPSPRATGR